jgi:hypothetical protein
MNKFVLALATVVSLGLTIPAFAEDAKMPMEKMGKPHMMGKHHMIVVHHLSSPLSSHDETGSEANVISRVSVEACAAATPAIGDNPAASAPFLKMGLSSAVLLTPPGTKTQRRYYPIDQSVNR